MEDTNKLGWSSPKTAIKVITILLIAGIVVISLIRDRIVNNYDQQVSFTGQGKIYYEPDTANVLMGVNVDQKTKADDALKELNEKMNKVIEAVKKAGIPKEDIKTQNYTLNPHYETISNSTRVTGYDANQVVLVKIKNIKENADLPSQIISAANQAGVNQINGISFEPSNIEDLKQEARLKAIADAKDKANNLSSALGVKLGKIISWWENSYPIQPYYSEMGGGGMGGGGFSSPTVPAGTYEIVSEVNITYKVK
jgi:uncharacterized protein YggE